MGWAQSCTVDEPAGLRPPALGFHRTCSGEQSHWTSSGEPSKVELSHGGALGWGPWGLERKQMASASRCLCPQPALGVRDERHCVLLSRLHHVECVSHMECGRDRPCTGEVDPDVPPGNRLPALSISIVRRGICVELKPSGVPGSQAVLYARLPQPRTSSKQVASASPDRDILS